MPQGNFRTIRRLNHSAFASCSDRDSVRKRTRTTSGEPHEAGSLIHYKPLSAMPVWSVPQKAQQHAIAAVIRKNSVGRAVKERQTR